MIKDIEEMDLCLLQQGGPFGGKGGPHSMLRTEGLLS